MRSRLDVASCTPRLQAGCADSRCCLPAPRGDHGDLDRGFDCARFVLAIGADLIAILLWQLAQNRTPHYADIIEEFKYGSIGTEPHSGIPYRIWRALPTLFPEDFAGRQDYSVFGFVYESDTSGHQRELPIGISLPPFPAQCRSR